MPKVKISKRQQLATDAVAAEPEMNENLISERLETLNLKYREKMLNDFTAENKGAKLDRVIEHYKLNNAINEEIAKAQDLMEEATQRYLESGRDMEKVYAIKKTIEELEAKADNLPSLPKDHVELAKQYARVLNCRCI